MKETLFAVYERKSTLWPRANYFYVLQDWTRMECLWRDYSEEREDYKDVRVFQGDKDITEEYNKEHYSDCYVVRLINDRRSNSKSFRFDNKDDANAFWKEVMNHRVLRDWHKV